MTPSTIIDAIRTRLVAAGYTVQLFRMVDSQTDSIPCVGVYFGTKGDTAELEGVSIEQHTLQLQVVLYSWGSSDDPEIEVLEQTEELLDELVKHNTDRPDQLDGACDELTVDRMLVYTRENQTDLIEGHIWLDVQYTRSNP